MSDIYPIAVPKWGIEMVEGTVNQWNKREGDSVAKGDEVFRDGVGQDRQRVGTRLLTACCAASSPRRATPARWGRCWGVIAGAEVDDAAIDDYVASYSAGAAEGAADSAPAGASAKSGASGAKGAGDAYSRSSPSVRKLADELGVDLNAVTGTGRRGRITEDDVRAAESGAASTQDTPTQDAPAEDVDIIPLSPTRKTIARRLGEAKRDIPHFYLTVEYELDGLLAHREKLNAEGDGKVSVNDLMVWCVAQALIKEPRVNVNLVGDDIHQFKRANVSLAIATNAGLYPATLYGAEALSPAEIAAAAAELTEKAQAGQLSKRDITGGSFTVSNLGMFGVGNFTAIVNPPMGAILALGKGEQRVVAKGRQARRGDGDQRHPVLRPPGDRRRGGGAVPASAGRGDRRAVRHSHSSYTELDFHTSCHF